MDGQTDAYHDKRLAHDPVPMFLRHRTVHAVLSLDGFLSSLEIQGPG